MTGFLFYLFFLLPLQNDLLIEHTHDYFCVDHLGNLYLVDNSELLMYKPNGDKMAVFSNSMLESISSIDVSDPLRILLFFKDFNQVLFLDRNLTQIGEKIDLYEYSNNETDLVCSSPNGGFWIYNSTDNQAVQFSKYGQKVQESILLNSFYGIVHPVEMMEHATKLYLVYPNMGVVVLDRNGQFLKKINIPKLKSVQFVSNSIIYRNHNGVFSYQPFERKDSLLYRLDTCKLQQIRVRNNKIYISNKKSVSTKSPGY